MVPTTGSYFLEVYGEGDEDNSSNQRYFRWCYSGSFDILGHL